MALCIPITKYRQVKKLRDDALGKVEDVTKEFDELKETTEEYKTKYEDLQKQMENAKSMSPGGLKAGGDDTDGGTLLLDEDTYKTEAIKSDSWPAEMKVKDLAKMSIEYLHQGNLTKDFKGSRGTLKGTMSIKPLEITVVNLSKTTTLQIASSYFKSGRFLAQPEGVIEAGESHTYGITSKDGRAKTSVKGGISFVVCDVPEPIANGDAGMEEEEEVDGDKVNKKTKEEKKKEKQEKKELKRQERKSKKEAKKKSRKGSDKGSENSEPKENGEGGEEEENPEENQENGEETEDKAAESNEIITEENEDGEQNESLKGEEPMSPKEPSIHEDHEEEDDMPEGNGDFLVVAFENPLAGIPKAKSSKSSSKDIKPLVKQLKNDKPVEQVLYGHYKPGKRHFVFIWKDEELQW